MKILQDWYNDNHINPYASFEEIQNLSSKTKLTTRQIKIWLANERKKKEK